jgi:SNF2 family DNA or RNA helicase
LVLPYVKGEITAANAATLTGKLVQMANGAVYADNGEKVLIHNKKLDSDASIRKWNNGDLPVALIHPASAGHWLNLQSGGNILIWFGLTWSLELYQQTVARLWRQGQSAATVIVQHICTADTIDDDIMDALEAKDFSQNRLIAAVKAEVYHE